MKKHKKILIIVFFVLCISIVAIAIYYKTSTIEIPDNPNLKISIDYMSAPSLIFTYYFYDDAIIETSHGGGLLPNESVLSTSTTKYYFNEKIDLSELKNFIDKIPRDTSGRNLVEITEKDGITYSIDDLNIPNGNSSEITLAHGELLAEIMKITDNAIRKQER